MSQNLKYEKLLEYIDERIEQLKEEGHRTLPEIVPEKREIIRQRFKGRIAELKKVREISHNNKFEERLDEIERAEEE